MSTQTITLKKANNPESHFWHFLGRLMTYLDLIGEGRLNFAWLEFNVDDIGKERACVILDFLGDVPDYPCDSLELYLDTDSRKEKVYIVIATNVRFIEEAKDLLQIKGPEEFYEKLKILEAGMLFNDDCDLIKRREKGRTVSVFIEQPIGSKHPGFGWTYPINYGYVRGAKTIYGDSLGVYILGFDEPIKNFIGKTVAIVYRPNEKTYKLIVAPRDMNFTDEEIEKAIAFQEQGHEYKIVR